MIWMYAGQSLWLWCFLPLFSVCALVWIRPFLRIGRGSDGRIRRNDKAPGTLSTGQAAGAALAATVGTGNIVGTAQAIALGGPGAVFWMWAATLLAIPVKAAEILLGQRFGGAMGYIRRALGTLPAGIYAVLALGNVLILGNMVQMNTVVSIFRDPDPEGAGFAGMTAALLLTVLMALCLQRGIGVVSAACVKLVGLMAGLYLAVCSAALILHAGQILPAFRLILNCALRPAAIGGAAIGLYVRSAFVWGLSRGAFSNEAGLGTAANIHAYTEETDPKRNALLGVAEVVVDTLLLCTVSAMVILTSATPIPYGTMPGSELMGQALAASFGEQAGQWLLGCCLGSFALSTVLGSYISGHRCADWLGIEERLYRPLFLGCTLLGPVLPLRWIWHAADTVNVLMALPNLLALTLLGRKKGLAYRRREDFQKIKESSLAPGRRMV